MHGSPEAKEAGDLEVQQHSKLVARGKYLHGFEIHKVKPDAGEAYKKAAEGYYAAIKDDPALHVKLSGSWETIVGEQDTFCKSFGYVFDSVNRSLMLARLQCTSLSTKITRATTRRLR